MIVHGQSSLSGETVRTARLTGLPALDPSPIEPGDSVLQAFGRLQGLLSGGSLGQAPSLRGLQGWTAPAGTAWVEGGAAVDSGPWGPGCAVMPGPGGLMISSNTRRLVIDTGRAYDFSVPLKGNGAGSFFWAFQPVDAEGRTISPTHVNNRAGTKTTLAAALNPGDQTVQLTSASGWPASGSGSWLAFGPFVSGGVSFGSESYTRLVGNSAGHLTSAPLGGDWGAAGLSGTTITLSAPWAGPAYAAGTDVSCHAGGVSYIYADPIQTSTPNGWTVRRGVIGPAPASLDGSVNGRWWPGTASLRVVLQGSALTAEARIGQPILTPRTVIREGTAAAPTVTGAPAAGSMASTSGFFWSGGPRLARSGIDDGEVRGLLAGTWTPALDFSATTLAAGSGSVGYSSRSGTWIRIGNLVMVQFSMAVNALTLGTASGLVSILGLPFTAAASAGGLAAGQVFASGMGAGITSPPLALFTAGGTNFRLHKAGAGGLASTAAADASSTMILHGSLIYTAA